MTTVKNLNVESINSALIEIQNYFDNTEIKNFINRNKNVVENLIAALNFIKLEYNEDTTELTWIDNKGVSQTWQLLGTIYNLTIDNDEVVLVNCNNKEEVHITVPYSVKATNDADGNNIVNTYSTKKENDTLETALKKLINDGLADELKRAQQAESDLNTKIDNGLKDINDKIPTEASSTNQLADKNYVNTSITQNTAFFRGTFTSLEALNAYKDTLTNNDYAFVSSTTDDFEITYSRYVYNSTTKEWVFAYALDNLKYNDAQWKAINSNITSDLTTKLEGIEAGAEVNIQADWTETTDTSDAYIKNKPNVVATTYAASKTVSEWSEKDGVVDIKLQDIDITHSQINDWPDFKTVATSGDYYDLSTAPGNFITKTNANDCVPEHSVYGQQWFYCSNEATNTPGSFSYFILTVKHGSFITQTAYTERASTNSISPIYIRTGVASGESWKFGNWQSQDCSTFYFDSTGGVTEYYLIDFSSTSGIRLDCNHGGYYIFGYNSTPILIGLSNSDNCVLGYKWDTSVSSNPKLYLKISTWGVFNIRVDSVTTIISKVENPNLDSWNNSFEKVIYQSTLNSVNVDKTGGADNKYVSAIAQSNAFIIPTISTADSSPTENSNKLITSDGVYKSVKAITDKIPGQASSTNQLADKEYVDNSISTNTATFYGSFETYSAFTEAWETNKNFTNNDYAVVISDETYSNQMSRYKYNGTTWAYEYKVNDTPFTSDQLAAINSGITSTVLSGIQNDLALNGNALTNTALSQTYAATAQTYANNANIYYNNAKDSSDNAASSQTSAYNSAQTSGYYQVISQEYASYAQTYANSAAESQTSAYNSSLTASYYANLIDIDNFVPTTRTINGKTLSSDISLTASDVGALSDTTVIPNAQVQTDWNATTGMGVLLNKPTIPVVDYPVTSVNSKTGSISLDYTDVGALADTTTHLSGDVPTTRTINGKTLSTNVTLELSDVGHLYEYNGTLIVYCSSGSYLAQLTLNLSILSKVNIDSTSQLSISRDGSGLESITEANNLYNCNGIGISRPNSLDGRRILMVVSGASTDSSNLFGYYSEYTYDLYTSVGSISNYSMGSSRGETLDELISYLLNNETITSYDISENKFTKRQIF